MPSQLEELLGQPLQSLEDLLGATSVQHQHQSVFEQIMGQQADYEHQLQPMGGLKSQPQPIRGQPLQSQPAYQPMLGQPSLSQLAFDQMMGQQPQPQPSHQPGGAQQSHTQSTYQPIGAEHVSERRPSPLLGNEASGAPPVAEVDAQQVDSIASELMIL